MTKLVRNYRSAGALLKLPSEVSYGGELVECADTRVTSSMGAWSQLVTESFPLLFYGCTSGHSLYKVDATSAHPSSSYRNVTEAEQLVELIRSLLEQHLDGDVARESRREKAAEEGEGGDDAEPDHEWPGLPPAGAAVSGGRGGRGGRGSRGRGGRGIAAPSAARAAAPSAAPSAASEQRRVTTNEIGVVTPFRAQVLLLRDCLGWACLRTSNAT